MVGLLVFSQDDIHQSRDVGDGYAAVVVHVAHDEFLKLKPVRVVDGIVSRPVLTLLQIFHPFHGNGVSLG